jgi:hypothetical protein
MFTSDDYASAFDLEQDRDLIALMNETDDPRELESLTKMAQQRLRTRHRRAAEHERTRHSSRRRFALPRALTFRA